MAYIELVIKIPEEVKQTFDNAKDEDLYGNYYDRNSLIGKAIRNGTPLPKGHGDLISRKDLLKELEKWDWQDTYLPIHFAELVADLPSAEKTAEWISVRKQKPEDYEEVIATVRYDYKDKQEYEVVTGVRYSKEDGWEWAYEAGADYWEKITGVVAWQPLPKPYEVKR